MAGIYLHIPFCKQACHYCNFHFVTSLRNKTGLVNALIKEIGLQKEYLSNETVETIYFGGGTPSLLTTDELQLLLSTIKTIYTVSKDSEITLEANPDDITEEKLIGWKQMGINRLSIGVQSFFDEDLQWMNRAHDAQQAMSNLHLAKKHFDNITIDLIYGTPQLTNENWKHNIDTAIALNIPHLSCYALTVEPKTPLHKMIRDHKSDDINPDKQSEQFLLLMQWLGDAGYEHYEISNFALPASRYLNNPDSTRLAGKPGWRSRHNSSYWQGKKYIGIGPSAHSFNGSSRQWNVLNNTNYIELIKQGLIPVAEKEILTATQKLDEYIMTALRTMEGISFEVLTSMFNVAEEEMINKAKKFTDAGLIHLVNNSLVLTREGKLLADGIAAELFF